MSSNIIAKCMGIAEATYFYILYKDQNIIEMYAPGGFMNKATGICHYCTIDTLKVILNKGCLRFSDVRFLNDSTEFVEILRWIENLIMTDSFSSDFRRLILESDEMKELEEYRQSYIGVSNTTRKYKVYRTYTCSFSTDNNALSMWNYYAQSAEGVNITFDHSWNMFDGSNRSEVYVGEKLENEIMIYRGLVIYKNEDKKKCIMELLNRLQEVYDEAKDDIKNNQGHILYAFKQAVNNMRCFFKNEYFECENEYRIVLRIPEELLLQKEKDGDSDIVEKGQFKRGNTLIPYVDYKFKKSSVERIVINPYIKDESGIFELGIKELLWMNQMQGIPIVHSNIPLRKYS
ncbi:MAG: DUF2971 domain-containing protein [Eubacteriales bacterium]|nr:DUF2971 domain-containing protein [Eubacteriales bacterium]